MSQQKSSSNTQGEKKFFDLHTRGLGYLNRTRWVSTKGKGGRRGDTFLACSINALHGDAEDPNTTLFDCNKVSGADARNIVLALMPDVDAGKKVLVGFTIGDIYAHVYERKIKTKDASGQWRETGESETAALIKGRLLKITHVKVDGEVVYHVNADGVIETTLQLATAEEQGEPESRTGTNG
jgi:hypothetical protein